jgi:large subunit ribosomal protein L6
MSRVGKEPITVPKGVDVRIDGRTITVKGPKGELSCEVPEPIEVVHEEGTIRVTRPSDEPVHRSLHGLSRTLIANLVSGVTEGFTKVLEMVGVGYRAEVRGRNLLLTVGLSHSVLVRPPEGITLRMLDGGAISVSGIDKYLVGQTAANIRALRPPEPYKGKGIRYQGEYVRRKAGKTAVGG